MPNVRLIDANALRIDIHKSFSDDLGILEYIDSAPTIEAEPVKRGKWIIGRHEFGTSWHCSMCDFIVDFKHRYCNNCGARMVNG